MKKTKRLPARRLRTSVVAGAAVLGITGLCQAESASGQAANPPASSANALFIMLGAVMILAMHGGFAFLEVGSVRTKNQVNALNKILCEWSFSTLAYFLIGCPIARGVSLLAPVGELSAGHDIEYMRFFLLLGFAACVPAIISGGVAERARFWTNAIAGGIFVGLVYPIIEGAAWGRFNQALAGTGGWLAALDGIQNKIDPGQPLDVDIYDLTTEELAKYPHTPGSLAEAIDTLEADHAFLTAGGVFTDDLIETWITWKRENELDPLALRPHPYEFNLYYDC